MSVVQKTVKERPLSTKEAAEYLGVSLDWLWRSDDGMKVPFHSIGSKGDRRYYVDEMDTWLRSQPRKRQRPGVKVPKS